MPGNVPDTRSQSDSWVHHMSEDPQGQHGYNKNRFNLNDYYKKKF